MSNYSGSRRAPNVSQYISGLNTIPSAQELASQGPEEFAGLADDMALFTNTDFYDLDLGETNGMSQSTDFDSTKAPSYETSPNSATFAKPDFLLPDFTFPANLGDPNSIDVKTGQPHNVQLQQSSSLRAQGAQAGDKRRNEYMSDSNNVQVMEEQSRMAAEEDKRRRNTAASARFRIKKKQREQALEKTAKEMTDKVSVLENKVTQLEMENKWLKGLITEKSEKSDIGELIKQYAQEHDKSSLNEERKDGVGTTN